MGCMTVYRDTTFNVRHSALSYLSSLHVWFLYRLHLHITWRNCVTPQVTRGRRGAGRFSVTTTSRKTMVDSSRRCLLPLAARHIFAEPPSNAPISPEDAVFACGLTSQFPYVSARDWRASVHGGARLLEMAYGTNSRRGELRRAYALRGVVRADARRGRGLICFVF